MLLTGEIHLRLVDAALRQQAAGLAWVAAQPGYLEGTSKL